MNHRPQNGPAHHKPGMRTYPYLMTLAVVAVACTNLVPAPGGASRDPADGHPDEIVLVSDVRWEQLNPARGDQSPQAGTLWGDRKGTVPTGYLIKFEDGFSSPPHIHNVSYRGVVIRGLVHNDDPDAARMWMPPGSFWTQPKGEAHITAAQGSDNMAYIEIDEGPYLVLPTARAFDSGERPVNVDASNVVWLAATPVADASSRSPESTDHAAVAFLWGSPTNGQLHGALVRLPGGFDGRIETYGASFKAIVIKGQPRTGANDDDCKTLEPGSYFASHGARSHHLATDPGCESVLYVRTDGGFEIVAKEQ